MQYLYAIQLYSKMAVIRPYLFVSKKLFFVWVKCEIRGYFLGHYEIRGYTTRDPGVLFETLHDMSVSVKYCLQLQGPNINYVSYLMCVPVSVVPIIPDGRLDQNGTPPCGGYRFCRRPCSCEATIHARINLAPRRGRRRPGDHSIRIP